MHFGNSPVLFRYAKGYDPDNWISIDVDTAEIKLNKVPDRESPFVVNGTYYAKIICITDGKYKQQIRTLYYSSVPYFLYTLEFCKSIEKLTTT